MDRIDFFHPIIHFRFEGEFFSPVFYPAGTNFNPVTGEGENVISLREDKIDKSALFTFLQNIVKTKNLESLENLVPKIKKVIPRIGNTLYLFFEKETEFILEEKNKKLKLSLDDFDWQHYFKRISSGIIQNTLLNRTDRPIQKFIELYKSRNLDKIDLSSKGGVSKFLESICVYLNIYPSFWYEKLNNKSKYIKEFYQELANQLNEALILKIFLKKFQAPSEENFYAVFEKLPIEILEMDKANDNTLQMLIEQLDSKIDMHSTIQKNDKGIVVLDSHSVNNCLTFANQKDEKNEFKLFKPTEIFNEKNLPDVLYLYVCYADNEEIRLNGQKTIAQSFWELDIPLIACQQEEINFEKALDFLKHKKILYEYFQK
ncbi:MAG: hypothetical protein KBF93_14400 [Leptospiraceae bacterium]|nr:hypothetical protein [Leptospiraceae bacterium]